MYYFCGEISVLFQNLLKSRSVQPIADELIRNSILIMNNWNTLDEFSL